jgi:hypothetical protein
MATSSEKDDDRSDTETSRDGDDEAPAGETGEKSSGAAGELEAGVAQEAEARRREGDATADPGDKGSAFSKSGKSATTARGVRGAAKRGAKPARKAPSGAAQASAARAPVKPKGGSLAKSVGLFVVIVGGLAAAFAVLGRDEGGGRAAPSWKTGQQVDVELTLVKTDREDLACSSPEELAGRHCAFEAQTKRWSKGDVNDDKKLLKPYTTTNGAELLAAGLWSEPALSGTLPATRFSVKCKYTVEGRLKKPSIRWATDRPWYDSQGDWYAGVVTGCAITP